MVRVMAAEAMVVAMPRTIAIVIIRDMHRTNRPSCRCTLEVFTNRIRSAARQWVATQITVKLVFLMAERPTVPVSARVFTVLDTVRRCHACN